MKHLRTLLTLLAVSIGALQGAWARTAPTMPEALTLESGKVYYLYNVGSDRFLTHEGTSYYNVYARTNQATAIKLSAVNGAEYTIQFVDNDCYLELLQQNVEQSTASNPTSNYYRVTITGDAEGYYIQRVYNSVETEFFGFDGTDGDRPKPNLTDGNIVWKLFDAEKGARFVAKRNLYRALESADGYVVDKYETVYANEQSTNYELQSAADELNDAVSASNKVTTPDWSDYKLLFHSSDLITNNWYCYDDYFGTDYIQNGSRTLEAFVEVDDDATLVFNYWRSSRGELSVSLDDVLQYKVNTYEGGDDSQRYFVEMAPGKHKITWKFAVTDKDNSGWCRILDIGVEQTPTIVVSLLEPGSLGTEVLNNTSHVQNVRKLVVGGEMNDDDWARILMMTSIFSLDLTDVTNTRIPDRQLSRSAHGNELSFLHEVKLPAGLKEIGESAFERTYLDAITLPETLTRIEDDAFYGTRIKEALIPESVTYVGESAFASNQSLETVSYPAAAVTIPNSCFSYCNVLQPFQIPEGITRVGNNAFESCYSFDSSLPSTLTSIGAFAFNYSGITNADISENASVGSHAFADCSQLVSITLPTTYYTEVNGMLQSCSSLRDVTFKSPTMVVSRYENIFSGNSNGNITLHVPSYLVNTYKLDSYWYNYNVVGFSTADVQNWIVKQPLKMSAGQRFEGTPDVKLTEAGTWMLSGDDAMTLGSLQTDFVNDYSGYVENRTSQILSNCDNITIEGDFVHNYYTESNRWYFVTLPFDTKVGDITSSSSFAVRYYDGANRAENGTGGNWKNYAKEDVIPAGTGFIFQTSQAVWSQFKAVDNASKQNVFVNKMLSKELEVNASDEKANKGWNLVGNPWMSYYNIHKMNFTAPITVWDPYYKTYTAYSVFDDDYAIRPNEAFFVQCPSEELTTIEFPIDGRQLTSEITDQNGARVAQPSERKLIDVELTDGESTDKTRFVLNPQASVDYELECDASKFFSMDASAPQIYTVEQGVQLAINERPLGEGTVQVGIRVAQDGEYTIKAGRNQFKNLVLADLETGAETDLCNDSYTFTAAKGTTEGRFVLRAGGTVVTGVQSVAAQSQQTGQAYNLQGQRVAAPQKGLFIVNGKKVMK